MENDRADGPERVRLPGFDEHAAASRPAHTWHALPSWPPPYPQYGGARYTRRVSNWTAAALVAGVAATTGYLAHSIPATSARSGTSTSTHSKAPAVTPANPVIQAPVVTSGGSGGGGGGGGRDN